MLSVILIYYNIFYFAAKVLLFFELNKFFSRFFAFSFIFLHKMGHITQKAWVRNTWG